jgi:ATP-dependent RNA helicase DDX42
MALDEQKLLRIRQELEIRVYGSHVPRPAISFAHFGFGDLLMEAILKNGYTSPTGIQQQAIPAVLSGRDLVAVAKTGSGKTAAFILPMLIHILDQPDLEEKDGPIALILAPTRELAVQIFTEAKKFAKCYEVKVSVIYGGANKSEQFKELRGHNAQGRGRGPDVLVATPGRLIDMIKIKATNLHRVSYLVLDEADKMFDLGFGTYASILVERC